jgi:hypothetical protein
MQDVRIRIRDSGILKTQIDDEHTAESLAEMMSGGFEDGGTLICSDSRGATRSIVVRMSDVSYIIIYT